jgi:CubicO group peptidase (beta-lactamase class C family)
MAPTLSLQSTTSLRNHINTSTSTNASTSTFVLPGALVHITSSHNTTLFSHGSGTPNAPTPHSISVIQSLSKLVGSIAYLRLDDHGLATLDDPTLIATHLPELSAKQVLIGYTTDADGIKHWSFENRVGDITPRMLLNHTYGGGHTYFNKLLYEYFQDKEIWNEVNEAVDTYGTLLASPLLFQPGTKTNYGQGMDWIAVLIEQPGNGGKFWPRVLRSGEGFVALETGEPARKKVRDDAFPDGEYHTGRLGTGLVSSAADYTRLLSILLKENGGMDSVTGYRVLSPAAVAELTKAQLPPGIRCDSRNVPASGASPIILPAFLEAPHMDPHGSFGLGCGVQGADRVLEDGSRGRSKGSVYWYGAANTEYWVDIEKRVVVYVNGNYYPWNDQAWAKFVAGVERLLYEGLQE